MTGRGGYNLWNYDEICDKIDDRLLKQGMGL